jgi:hypothetical protein
MHFFSQAIPAGLSRGLTIGLYAVQFPWALLWLWALHGLWHQLAALFLSRPRPPRTCVASTPPVAILYTTCDDFDPDACQSLVEQDYLHVTLVICDDSSTQAGRDQIDAWVASTSGDALIVRRPDRRGFKAGNLNHAIAAVVTEPLFVVCDADQILPRSYVTDAVRELGSSGAAFVQCRHVARSSASTWFERALGPAIDMFYGYLLPSRQDYGFVCFFGHGAVVRRAVWQDVGGFPEIVTEDLAFAMAALARGHQGSYTSEPHSAEAFPITYSALASKYRRVVGGTIETWRRYGRELLRSPHSSRVEKLDAVLTFSTCYLPLVTLISVIASLGFSYLSAGVGYAKLQRWLLVLYLLGPQTPLIAWVAGAIRQPRRYASFVLVGSIAYSSLLPLLAWTAIQHTVWSVPPVFLSSGAVGRRRESPQAHLWTIGGGVLLIVLAVMLPSPAAGPTMVLGSMFVVGPALTLTGRPGVLGGCARWSIAVPAGLLMVGIIWAGW